MDVLKQLIVADWAQAPKWFSVQASALFGAIAYAWTYLSDDDKVALLSFIGIQPGSIVAVAFGLVVVGRLAAQAGLIKPAQPE